jgi:alcohol dehydrogenase (cytochrome c)
MARLAGRSIGTYDAQRFSPLDQINRRNVGGLRMAWVRGMGPGQTETIPIVHEGVMYVVEPGAVVAALDATTGDLVWEYKRRVPANVASVARTKNLAIYQDLVFYTAPDAVVGLDARTGERRWEATTDGRGNTSGPIVVEGKVLSGGACAGKRENCFLVAHDALTGKEIWRFYTTPAPGEPGDETWGGAALDKRMASTWGLPGTYDAGLLGDRQSHAGSADRPARWQPRCRWAPRTGRSIQQFHGRARPGNRQARLVLPASAG